MSTNVIYISPGDGVRHIASIMIQHEISAVPVVDDNGDLVGIVSEGDLMQRPETGARSPWWLDVVDRPIERLHDYVKSRGTLAREVMTTDVVCVDETAAVSQIARLLLEKRIKRVPVLRNGRMVGIVSRADLLQAVATAPHDQTASGDEAIQLAVSTRIREEARLQPELLAVSVHAGVVRMSGLIRSELEREAAVVAAWSVRGVHGVVDQLTVQGKPEEPNLT